MEKLPYRVKELINLFALKTYKDYERLVVFNEICDYKPCEYSPLKLQNAEANYVVNTKSFIKYINYNTNIINAFNDHHMFCIKLLNEIETVVKMQNCLNSYLRCTALVSGKVQKKVGTIEVKQAIISQNQYEWNRRPEENRLLSMFDAQIRKITASNFYYRNK